jgi:two-component system response regulator FixJ
LAVADRETVYIIDDDPGVRESARALLETYGLAVVEFASARAFLDACKERPKVACLLLDLNMPEMGGLELLDRLRRRNIGMPVIIVTAQSDREVREQARRAGAFAFVEKPIAESLIAAIDRALHSSH